jgi:hypothetical protein
MTKAAKAITRAATPTVTSDSAIMKTKREENTQSGRWAEPRFEDDEKEWIATCPQAEL